MRALRLASDDAGNGGAREGEGEGVALRFDAAAGFGRDLVPVDGLTGDGVAARRSATSLRKFLSAEVAAFASDPPAAIWHSKHTPERTES